MVRRGSLRRPLRRSSRAGPSRQSRPSFLRGRSARRIDRARAAETGRAIASSFTRSARRILVVALLALALPAAAARTSPAATGRGYGMNFQGFFAMPAASWDQHLAAIAGLGVRWVRSDAFWSTAEPHAPVAGVHR